MVTARERVGFGRSATDATGNLSLRVCYGEKSPLPAIPVSRKVLWTAEASWTKLLVCKVP